MLTRDCAESPPFSPAPWTIGENGCSIRSPMGCLVTVVRSKYKEEYCRVICAAPLLFEAFGKALLLMDESCDNTGDAQTRFKRIIGAAESTVASACDGTGKIPTDLARAWTRVNGRSYIIESALPPGEQGHFVARVCETGWLNGKPCRDANVELIRSAPILYDACQYALGSLNEDVVRTNDDERSHVIDELMAALEAADEGF